MNEEHVKIIHTQFQQKEGLNPVEYQFMSEGLDPNTGLEVIQAWHKDDLALKDKLTPGANSGKSRVIHFDPGTSKVVSVLKWQ